MDERQNSESALEAQIRECQQRRARLIKTGLKETPEYRANNDTEDRLLDELFKLRFPRVGLIADTCE